MADRRPPQSLRAVLVAALVALLAASLTGTPAAADHPDSEDPADHLNVNVEDVEPGQTRRVPIESVKHGPLREGWIYIMHGLVQGNHSLDVVLELDNETMDETVWEPGQPNTLVTKIQKTGYHELLITNEGEETVRYAFYYDQSCNCDSKWIPLQEGVVMFNYPLEGGTTVDISYPIVKDWHVYGALASHDNTSTTAKWPDDFQIIEEQEVQGPGAGQDGWGWLNYTFTPPESATYYVYLKALNDNVGPDNAVMLSATIEPRTEEAPAPGVWMILAAAGALVAGIRRRLRPTA